MATATRENTKRYVVKHLEDLDEFRSTCGFRRSVITDQDTDALSMSVLRISDSTKHYHLKTSEVYYILEGEGQLELNEDVVPLRPGTAVFIEPGVRHSAKGEVTALIVGVPPFDKDDTLFD